MNRLLLLARRSRRTLLIAIATGQAATGMITNINHSLAGFSQLRPVDGLLFAYLVALVVSGRIVSNVSLLRWGNRQSAICSCTPPEVLASQELMTLLLQAMRADFALLSRYRYQPRLRLGRAVECADRT